MGKKLQFKIFLIFLVGLITPPVHAYGGPGVALAAVLVFITVVFAFLASTFISIYSFIKKILKKIFKKKLDNPKKSNVSKIKKENIK